MTLVMSSRKFDSFIGLMASISKFQGKKVQVLNGWGRVIEGTLFKMPDGLFAVKNTEENYIIFAGDKVKCGGEVRLAYM